MSISRYQRYREVNLRCAATRYQRKKEEIKTYQREWRKKNKEKIRGFRSNSAEYRRQKYTENPEKYKLIVRARQAKTSNKIVYQEIGNWGTRLCGICGEFIEGNSHIDHIVSLARGGEHVVSNLQLTHPICNLKKGAG